MMRQARVAVRMRAAGTDWRPIALLLMGPLTVVAAGVWTALQPYRLTLLDPRAYGIWDHIAEPPLLVAAVGVLYHFFVARPLADELRKGH